MTRTKPRVTAPAKPTVRCAIYTRKSTEDGIQQEFNSLDAQRDAGENYIRSQEGEGWQIILDQYDDGGFTGGNMDRPALKRLMADIDAGKVDCVVVYKVDRLSRSLLDFSKLLETFEKRRVSFVSVIHGRVKHIDRCLYVYHVHAGNTCRGEQNGFIQTETLALHDRSSIRSSNAGATRPASGRLTCVAGSTRLPVTSRSTCTAAGLPPTSTRVGHLAMARGACAGRTTPSNISATRSTR